jgi:hypothetical protein
LALAEISGVKNALRKRLMVPAWGDSALGWVVDLLVLPAEDVEVPFAVASGVETHSRESR